MDFSCAFSDELTLPSESVKQFADVDYVPMQGGGKAQPWMMPIYGQGAEAEMMDFLYVFVRLIRPELIVDLGSNVGLSAYALGRAAQDNGVGRVITCDIDRGHVLTTHARCAGLPVTCRLQSAADMPEVALADFLFLDCDYENRIAALHRFPPGATAVMHDTRQEPLLLNAIKDSGLPALHWKTWRGFSVIQK